MNLIAYLPALLLLALSFTLSFAQIRILSTSNSFQSSLVAIADTTSREDIWTLPWKITDRRLTSSVAFIGLKGLDVPTTTIDFEISFVDTPSDVDVTMKITAGPNCAVNLIEHFVLSALDYRVALISSYNFGSDSSFLSNLGTGNADGEVVYTVPYTPSENYDSFYESDATAFVSFTRVKLDPTSTEYHFDYQLIEVTNSSVKLKIRKFGDTRIQELKGQILVVANATKAELGFASTKIAKTFSPPFGQTGMMFTEEVSTRSDYTGRPEHMFFLSGYNFNNNYLGISTGGELGVSASNTITITLLSRKISSSQIRDIQYDVLLFCENENDCISFQNPGIVTGNTQLTSFIGTELSDATITSDRSLSLNVALKTFFTFIPSYQCIGIQDGNAEQGFSISISSATINSITITIKAFANRALNSITISYVVSSWSGFQCSFINLTPYLPLPVAPASDWLNIPVSITQDPVYGFSGNVLCQIALTELDMPTIQPVSFSTAGTASGITSDTTVSCSMQVKQGTYTSLKGYVIIYADPDSVDTFYGLATMETIPTTLTNTGYFPITGTLTKGQINYAVPPYVFSFANKLDFCGTLSLEATSTVQYYLRGPTCAFTWSFNIRDTSCSSPSFGYFAVSFFRKKPMDSSYASNAYGFEIISSTNSLCLLSDFTTSGAYALVVADESEYGKALEFKRSPGKVPRIIHSYILTLQPAGSFRKATVPFGNIPGSSKLTYHIKKHEASTSWGIMGTEDYYTSFPLVDQMSFRISAIGAFGYNGLDLPGAKETYKTVVASKIYQNDQSAPFSCQAQITFSGIIRSVYIDSQLVIVGSSPDTETSITLTSEIRASFQIDISNSAMVTVVGSLLVVTNFEFVNCLDMGESPITPAWTTYVPSISDTLTINDYNAYSEITPPSGCLTPKDASTCYVCQENYYLFQGTCVELCKDATSFIPVADVYCGSSLRNSGVKRSPTIYSDKTITIDYSVSSFSQTDAALTMFYPYDISYTNYPVVLPLNPATPSLADSSLLITKPTSSRLLPATGPGGSSKPSFQIFSITGSYPVNSIATPSYLQVQIVVIGMLQNGYMFILLDPTRLHIVLQKQFMSPKTPVTTVGLTDIFQLHAVIDCASCNILLDFNGHVEITLNQRTIIYSNTFTARATYQTFRTLSGISYLTFQCTQSTYFSFSIVGTHTMYSSDSLLFKDSANVAPVNSPCSIPNCHNCNGDKCLSCSVSYYLTTDGTSCVTDCPNWPGERLCKETKAPTSYIIETARVIDRIRKISNEAFSEISALMLRGIHSYRSQCIQKTLGYFIFLNVDYPSYYIDFAYDNYADLNLGNPWENAHVTRKLTSSRFLEIDAPMEIEDITNLDQYLQDHRMVKNIGYTLVMLIASTLLIPIIEVLHNKLKKIKGHESKWYYELVQTGSLTVRWSYVLNEFISRYQELTFFSLLGIYDKAKNDGTSLPDNFALSIVGTAIISIELILLFLIVRKVYQHVMLADKEEDEFLQRRKILHRHIRRGRLMQLLYPFFLILRVFGFSVTLIFLSGSTVLQLVFLDLYTILMIVYLIVYKPFEEQSQTWMTLAYEVDFLVALVAVTILHMHNQAGGTKDFTKDFFGTLLIIASLTMTVLNFISIGLELKEVAPKIIAKIKEWRRAQINRRTIAPSSSKLDNESPTLKLQLTRTKSKNDSPTHLEPPSPEKFSLILSNDNDINNSFSDNVLNRPASIKPTECSSPLSPDSPISNLIDQKPLTLLGGSRFLSVRTQKRLSSLSPSSSGIRSPSNENSKIQLMPEELVISEMEISNREEIEEKNLLSLGQSKRARRSKNQTLVTSKF